MKGLMSEKGQGSMEYLLIVAGAIALAAIVIYMVLVLSKVGATDTGERLDDFNCLAGDGNGC